VYYPNAPPALLLRIRLPPLPATRLLARTSHGIPRATPRRPRPANPSDAFPAFGRIPRATTTAFGGLGLNTAFGRHFPEQCIAGLRPAYPELRITGLRPAFAALGGAYLVVCAASINTGTFVIRTEARLLLLLLLLPAPPATTHYKFGSTSTQCGGIMAMVSSECTVSVPRVNTRNY